MFEDLELQRMYVNKEELDTQLMRQEHRFFHVLYNFFVITRGLKNSDPKRRAAISALLWRIISPGSAAIAGVGLATFVSLFSYFELRHQNELLSKQNEHIRTSNETVQKQLKFLTTVEARKSRQEEDTLRRELLDILYNVAASPSGESEPRASLRSREEAIVTFITSERNNDRIPRLNSLNMQGADLSWLNLEKISLRHSNLSGTDLTGAILKNADLTNANLDNSNLQSTVLTGAILQRASFKSSKLIAADLTGADLREAKFNKAQVGSPYENDFPRYPCPAKNMLCSRRYTSLARANLQQASLGEAILAYVDLGGARLVEASLNNVNAYSANFSGATIGRLAYSRVSTHSYIAEPDQAYINTYLSKINWTLAICPDGTRAKENCLDHLSSSEQ